MKKSLLATLLTLISIVSFAQNGEKYFKDKDYARAALAYEREAPASPVLYLNLAKTYFALQEFDKALDALDLYVEKYPTADQKYVEQLESLIERDDELVKVENLGPVLNSAKSDFLPRIMQDGKTLYFLSTDRPSGKGGEDIWFSTLDEKGNWSSPNNLTVLNTSSHEGILAISPDEKVAIVFGNYSGSFGSGDLFYSVKNESGWTPPCNLGGTINSSRWESLACIGPDGKTLIYSTNMNDGNESDLYVTFLSENGWSKPLNLGPKVNSKQQEKFPFLSADGKTMYFSSDGHFGFGGTDMFVSRRLDDTWANWSEPVNMGKYINTLDNDADLSIPASGKMAYIVRSNSQDGYGESDIYRFLLPFNMRPEQLFKIYGYVHNEKDSAVQVNIKFIDMATNKEVTKATSRDSNGYYSTALPLNKKYMAVIDMKGYLYYSEIIDLTDPEKYRNRATFQQKIVLQKEKLDKLKITLDQLNNTLGELNGSNSDKIRETFERYEKLNKDYKGALAELDALIYKVKYDWMTEAEELILQKDFKVQTAKIGTTFELKNIFFDLGKATLRPESKIELDKLFEILNYSEIVIELGGHTDSIGSDEANNLLSQERVNAVSAYLTEKGISPKRLVAVGYGEKQPIAPNYTDEGRQKNRRVEVKILKVEADREGSDRVTEEDKRRKDTIETVQALKKGDMLPVLQAAARKGGLPSGSDCNTTTYVPVKPNVYIPPVKDDNLIWSKWFRKTPLTLEENVFKRVNFSLLNFKYKSIGEGSMGGAITMVKKKKLHENQFEFYFSNPENVKGGVGYTHHHIIQAKPKLGLPLNFILGLEGKTLYYDDSIRSDAYWNFNVPLGMRLILPVNKFVLAPEFIYSIGLFQTKNIMQNTSYMKIGLTARYRFIHFGIYGSKGEEISYAGYRIGLSF
jgi:outer membrane protein OmpA-like peptidoglycan-associated protein